MTTAAPDRQPWPSAVAMRARRSVMRARLLHRPATSATPGVTWRLNFGMPPTEVASWAGHIVPAQAGFWLVVGGAPSRIRTCAPGSGGRCSIP